MKMRAKVNTMQLSTFYLMFVHCHYKLKALQLNKVGLSTIKYQHSKNLRPWADGQMPLEPTRGSAIEEPRDALRQLKYYGRFLTELLTRSSANPEEPCEHTVS